MVAPECADDKSQGAISQSDLPHSTATPQTESSLQQAASAGKTQYNSSRRLPDAVSTRGSLLLHVLFHPQKHTPHVQSAFCFPLTGFYKIFGEEMENAHHPLCS